MNRTNRKRFDERDTMFARMAWEQGGPAWEDYHLRHPELLNVDEELRAMPPLGAPGTPAFNPLAMPVIDGVFSFLADLHPLVEQEPSCPPKQWDRDTASRWVRGIARRFGAHDAATLAMRPDHYYSHRGRHEYAYGREVTDLLPYGVVFSSPMDVSMIHCGPMAPEAVETVRGYLNAAVTAFALAYSIRQMGYRARVHMDGNYLLVAPIVARDAGLGVVGRMGLLMDREHGPCLRLGAVTTDMPLTEGKPNLLMEDRVRTFCGVCRLCSERCPGRALDGSAGDPETAFPWKTDSEACFRNWKRFGTDCGVCISTCPFTVMDVWDRLEHTGDVGRVCAQIMAEYQERWPRRPYDSGTPGWLTPPALPEPEVDKN